MKNRLRMLQATLLSICAVMSASTLMAAEPRDELKVHISWGHRSASARVFQIRVLTEQVEIADTLAEGMESGDRLEEGLWRTAAGAGDVDGLLLTLRYADMPIKEIQNLHSIWKYLFEHSDADTASRLRGDPAFRPDARKLTIQTDEQGTQGFSVTVDQLLRNKALWCLHSTSIWPSATHRPPLTSIRCNCSHGGAKAFWIRFTLSRRRPMNSARPGGRTWAARST